MLNPILPEVCEKTIAYSANIIIKITMGLIPILAILTIDNRFHTMSLKLKFWEQVLVHKNKGFRSLWTQYGHRVIKAYVVPKKNNYYFPHKRTIIFFEGNTVS